jgi:hypothetical protein
MQVKRRNTGFPDKVKLMARTRAGGGDPRNARCEAHGGWLGPDGGDYQHRLARRMGGSPGAAVNGAENCAVLCRPCHDLCEARDDGMEARGWWIRSGNGPAHDPRHVPVMLMGESGSGALQYLTADGHYSSAPPSEVAA